MNLAILSNAMFPNASVKTLYQLLGFAVVIIVAMVFGGVLTMYALGGGVPAAEAVEVTVAAVETLPTLTQPETLDDVMQAFKSGQLMYHH